MTTDHRLWEGPAKKRRKDDKFRGRKERGGNKMEPLLCGSSRPRKEREVLAEDTGLTRLGESGGAARKVKGTY